MSIAHVLCPCPYHTPPASNVSSGSMPVTTFVCNKNLVNLTKTETHVAQVEQQCLENKQGIMYKQLHQLMEP